MLIYEKIKTIKLSYSQKHVADYLLNERSNIKHMRIKDIAKETYTSPATVVRLAEKLGYQSFNVFKEEFLKEIEYLDSHFKNIDANFPFDKNDSVKVIANKITTLISETLQDTLALIDIEELQEAVEIMTQSETIYLNALSLPMLYGQVFKLNMTRIGKTVITNDISGDELFITPIVKETDCAIFISYSGGMDKLIYLANQFKKKNIPIIVITSLGDNALKEFANVVLHITTREKLYSKIGGFSNETSIKLILDMLYACYFATNFDQHLETRISISKESEYNRMTTSDVLKED